MCLARNCTRGRAHYLYLYRRWASVCAVALSSAVPRPLPLPLPLPLRLPLPLPVPLRLPLPFEKEVRRHSIDPSPPPDQERLGRNTGNEPSQIETAFERTLFRMLTTIEFVAK